MYPFYPYTHPKVIKALTKATFDGQEKCVTRPKPLRAMLGKWLIVIGKKLSQPPIPTEEASALHIKL